MAGARIPIITSVSRSSRLSANEGERIDSVIISIQISNDSQTRTDLGDEPVTLVFNIGMEENTTRFRPHCAFFDFSNLSNQSGRFSVDGIAVITRNSTYVQCASNHLTSFAVLVDVSGQHFDAYIWDPCLLCRHNAEAVGGTEGLTLTLAMDKYGKIVSTRHKEFSIFPIRESIFNHVQHFIHLNLCIALLLGLITFVSGIEIASKYRAICLIVAILLHYFFMATFSWMLCEGILLFISLQYLFYEGAFLSRKFFFLIGWGLPIPIVIASAAISHDKYGINDRCWISEKKGAIWAFIGPMLVIIMVNLFFLAFVTYKVYTSKSNKERAVKVSKLDTAK
ncbi:adhesion G protein-coupled receptor L4-like [Dysidea avara]|uniref:adhesion G protein-coupled receptor L4-like n=1 Tax=Dysidea avara TaxID=196820 RepID=UPI00332985A8